MSSDTRDGGDEHALYGRDSVDVTTPAFARRLANLLAARRRQRGCSLRTLARQSHHAFTARDLRAYEDAAVELDEEKVDVVADLYGVDLDEILVERVELSIDAEGVLSTSGLDAAFTPEDDLSLLVAYLRLVRQMRDQQGAPTIQLRREDVEVLADFIGETGPTVIDRLGALMGATATQRRAMAGMFLAGAVVICLAGGTVTAISADRGTTGTGPAPTAPITVVADTTTADTITADIVTADGVTAAPRPTVAPTSTPTSEPEPDDATAASTPQVAPTTPTTAAAVGTADSGPTSTTASLPDAVATAAIPPAPPAGRPHASSPTAAPSPTPAPADAEVPSDGGTPAIAAAPHDASDVGAGGSIFSSDVPTEAAPISAPVTTTPRVDTGASDGSSDGAVASGGGDLPLPDLAVAAPPVPAPADGDSTEPGAPPLGG